MDTLTLLLNWMGHAATLQQWVYVFIGLHAAVPLLGLAVWIWRRI